MADLTVVLNRPAIEYLTHDPRSDLIRPLLQVSGEVVDRGAQRVISTTRWRWSSAPMSTARTRR